MTGTFSRRGFLSVGAGAGLVAATNVAIGRLALADHQPADQPPPSGQLTFPSPELTPYVDEMPIPPILRGSQSLAIAASSHQFHRDLGKAKTWSYGGQSYLGPTIEAVSGEPIELEFTNSLGAHLFANDIDTSLDGASEEDKVSPRVSVHLHGAVTEPAMDGHPDYTFLPGQTLTYKHENGQEAANLWYHDHAMGITRLNVVAGLAGMYFLRDEYDTGSSSNKLGLPSGDFEVPLILADRRFHDDGSLNFRTVTYVPEGHWEGGQIGDRMTVNGVVSPYSMVAAGRYRFRVLNASNARSYHLYFTDRRAFWVVGNDGGLLNAPVRTTSVRVSPGERIDLVVDFSDLAKGGYVDLTNDQEEAAAVVAGTGVRPLTELVRFIGTGSRGDTGTLPNRLRGGTGQPPVLAPLRTPAIKRVVTLTSELAQRWPPIGMTLNNLCYGDEPTVSPRQGTTEIWEVVNASIEGHPIHLHLVNMRLLNRQNLDVPGYLNTYPRPEVGTQWTPPPDRFLLGAPQEPEDWETGSKDTINCPQNMVTRFLVRFPTADELGFDPDAAFVSPHGMQLQGYVWHCHIIDHEDDCMMARYRLVSDS
jgi:FtsP/CotA-like multicopper oxidase with cupredoxin domain